MKKLLVFLLVILAIGGFVFLKINQKKPAPDTSTPIKKQVIAPSEPTEPIALKINRFGINAGMEYVGLDKENRMDVPKNPASVAWYKLGPKPGEQGSAVIAGHLDDPSGKPAVFWNVGKLGPGDKVEVIDSKGDSYAFTVSKTVSYNSDSFPLVEVFGTKDKKRLNLITCAGVWDKNKRSYTQRTVVYAEMK